MLQKADPDVQTAVTAAAATYENTVRRRLEADLISGNFRQRMRQLEVSDATTGGRKLANRLLVTAPTFDEKVVTDLMIEQKRTTDPVFKSGIAAGPVINMLCEMQPERCNAMESFVDQVDTTKSGYLDANAFDDLKDRVTTSAEQMKQPDQEPPQDVSKKGCKLFDGPSIYSPEEISHEEVNDAESRAELFNKLNTDGDMMVTKAECEA